MLRILRSTAKQLDTVFPDVSPHRDVGIKIDAEVVDRTDWCDWSIPRLVECQSSGATQVGPMIGQMSAIADFDMGVAMALHVCLSLSSAIADRAVGSMATFMS